MSMYINGTIKEYIDDLAARKPAPGGGSAAGACGGLAIALLEMVCNFTIGGEKYKALEKDIGNYLVTLKKIREEFTALIDEDVRVYSEIRKAFRTKDNKIIDNALKAGYDISLKMCRLSKKGLEIALDLSKKGNVNLITDVGCGAELLNAVFNSSIFNCDINLKGIEDKDFTAKEKLTLDTLKKGIAVLYRDSILNTKERMK